MPLGLPGDFVGITRWDSGEKGGLAVWGTGKGVFFGVKNGVFGALKAGTGVARFWHGGWA